MHYPKKIVTQLERKPINKTLIIALDHDKAGCKATGKLIELLATSELNTKFISSSSIYGEYKDVNAFLMADKNRFADKLMAITEYVKNND